MEKTITIREQDINPDLAATFIDENNKVRRQQAYLVKQTTPEGEVSRVDVFTWDANEKSFLPAKRYDGFLGPENLSRPRDWSAVLRPREQAVSALNQGAEQALSAIEADRRTRTSPISGVAVSSHEQPSPREGQFAGVHERPPSPPQSLHHKRERAVQDPFGQYPKKPVSSMEDAKDPYDVFSR